MKKCFLQWSLLLLVTSLFAKDVQMQTREFPQEELKKQKVLIASLAAKELSKTLPQKIDHYTTLQSVKNRDATLVYTFVINTADKSDESIIKEDHTRMQRVVIRGVCQSSARFLDAGINTSYIYVSAKSKKQLFRFDVTKERCKNLAAN